MRHTLLTPINKSLRNLAMLSAVCILLAAPLAQASIGTDEVDDFVKWPLYQECGDVANAGVVNTAGLTFTGTSEVVDGDPTVTKYPSVKDEAKFAAAMEAFIKKATPNGPWAKIPNIGAKLAAEGKLRNVNPMMIIVIGRHETNLGSDGGASARNNNSFGNKGNGPNGYRTWPSVEASLIGEDSFTKAVQDRLTGKHPNYVNVKNMYEYLSVHISGQIIYPGDTTAVHDDLMNVDVKVENVVHYFDLAKQWIGEMTGLKITGQPQRTAPANQPPNIAAAGEDLKSCFAANETATNGSGAVSPEGYSWPLEDQKQRDYGGSGPICAKESTGCHHLGGVSGKNQAAAFDLMYGGNANMNGKKVYAISDGTIFKMGTYRNVTGCFSANFKSSKDGLNYWYGHLQKANLSLINKPIKAGTQFAEVAGPQLGPVCHGRDASAQPGSHLHIDRGCPGYGGGGACRDISFVKFMNNFWRTLPK